MATRDFVADYEENGQRRQVRVAVRFNDECGSGHNMLAVTAEDGVVFGNGHFKAESFGCQHELVLEHFPELADAVMFHLCSTDGPMHYLANTEYHADSHGPTMAYVYFGDDENGVRLSCVRYCSIAEAERVVESDDRYSLEINHDTAKTASLDYARFTACWPDATDEELTAPGLRDRLLERLPVLMDRFRATVEDLGFEYTEEPITDED